MQDAGHLDDIVLEQYAMNRLSAVDAERVEDHISLCASCLDRLDDASAVVHNIRDALTMNPELQREPAQRPKWVNWKNPVWATMAIAAALLLFFVWPREPLAPLTSIVVDGTRGASTVVHGLGPFDFELFMPESAPTYRVALLDADGGKIWGSDVAGKDGKLHAIVRQRLKPGQYFIRVSDPSSQSMHEYGVRIDR
jgi:hypothetical protein